MQEPTATAEKKHELSRRVSEGRFSDAMPLALELARQHPQDPEVLYILAGLYARENRLQEVIDYCHRVTQLVPDHAGAWHNLAIAWSRLGQYGKAAEASRREISINPGTAAAHYRLGLHLQVTGDSNGAAAAYRQALQLQPEYVEALNNLGHILNQQGQLQAALECFLRQVRIAPGSCEGHNNLGVVYESLCQYPEAEAAYRKAIELHPGLVEARCHLGYLLADQGRTREALTCFEQVLALDDTCTEAIAGKAVAHEKSGQTDAAYNLLAPLMDNSKNVDMVLAWCRIASHRDEPEAAIPPAKRLLNADNLPPKGIVDLHYALGELYDRTGHYQDAFRHYHEANERSPRNYDHNRQRQLIDDIIKTTAGKRLTGLPQAAKSDRRIVFIVGMPRSGTSLTEQVLACHPDVFGAGELPYIGNLATAAYPQALTELSQAQMEALAGRYHRYIDSIDDTAAPVVTDKLPHNFLYLGLIQLLFPDARIVHMMRDPLDNCLSLYFHSFNPMHSYTTDLTLLGQYYREYQRLMEHWRNNLNIPMLDLHYEDMVADLPGSTRRLLEFCDLDWSENCLNFHTNRRFVKTPSYDQVRRPIYTAAVGRWRHYADFISPLRQSLGKEGD